jgi:dCMP deaminase
MEHRENRISWGDKWMLEALITAQRSPDPNTQVGAVIVTKNNRPVASGYNGPPRGIHPTHIPWNRDKENPLDNKYAYIVHAETNAIHNATASTKGCMLYTTLFPCNECAKNIIQAGIAEVVYLDNPYKDTWSTKAADYMLGTIDISVRQHQWEIGNVISCLQTLLNHVQNSNSKKLP